MNIILSSLFPAMVVAVDVVVGSILLLLITDEPPSITCDENGLNDNVAN